MKLECKIVEDLLPLYMDNVCSDETKKIVEEHLKECEVCQGLLDRTCMVTVPKIELDHPQADGIIEKGFRKIRFRWWASVLVIAFLVPLLFLGWNQYHGQGVHYTNIHELQIGHAFMKYICAGDFEKAYSYIDIEGLKQRWLEEWFDENELENMDAEALAKFCEYGANMQTHGGIERYDYVGISYFGKDGDGTPIYQMIFKITYAGTETLLDIMVSDDGIEYFSGNGSFLSDPLAQFAIWSEFLWQEYEGCYFDFETKQYVYYEE